MNYCIVKDGIIVNIIVCDNDATANEFGAVPSYEGADIGYQYNPPEPAPAPEPDPKPTTEELLNAIDAQVTYTAMMTDTMLPEV